MIRTLFKQMDSNNDGVVTFEEWLNYHMTQETPMSKS